MTTPTTPEPGPAIAEIAKGLTDAQREAILALPANGSCADAYTNPPWPALWMRAELGELGEMRPGAVFNHGFRLTPLGLAVRDHLSQPLPATPAPQGE